MPITFHLTPQPAGTLPPHDVHPKIAVTGIVTLDELALNQPPPDFSAGPWSAPHPVTVFNNAGNAVSIFIREFANLPFRDDEPILLPPGAQQTFFPIRAIWLGLAWQGRYGSTAEFFAQHPPGEGHHTEEIGQIDGAA